LIDNDLAAAISKSVEKNFSRGQEFLVKIAETNSSNSRSLDGMPVDYGVEMEVASLIRQELKEVGIGTELWGTSKKRANVVGVVGPVRARKNIVLNTHMDTAEPVGPVRGDPLATMIRGKKMYGLGLMRSKAMIACFVYVARILKELELPLLGKVILQFVVDEVMEGDGALGTKFLIEKGVKAKAAIMGSPGEVIGIGHRGGYRFKLATKGELVETASLMWQQGEKGRNAITEMVRAVQAVKDLELPYKAAKAFPGKKPVLTFPTMIEGGVAIDVVPDECIALGDVRLMPGNSDRQVRMRIEERLNSLTGLRYRLEDLVYVPAVEVDQKEEVVQIMTEETRKVRGQVSEVEGIGSWNSAWMYIQKDIPTIVQVPLEGGEYRGNHDWVELTSLRELTEILVRVVVEYVGVRREES